MENKTFKPTIYHDQKNKKKTCERASLLIIWLEDLDIREKLTIPPPFSGKPDKDARLKSKRTLIAV